MECFQLSEKDSTGKLKVKKSVLQIQP